MHQDDPTVDKDKWLMEPVLIWKVGLEKEAPSSYKAQRETHGSLPSFSQFICHCHQARSAHEQPRTNAWS